MTIRPFEPQDLQTLERLHAEMGLDYALPEKFFSLVLTNERTDEPEQALLFRPTAELYHLMSHQAGTPSERWEKFQALHEQMRRFAAGLGLSDVHVWLQPGALEKRFGARLKSIGWEKAEWISYVFDLSREAVPHGARAKASCG